MLLKNLLDFVAIIWSFESDGIENTANLLIVFILMLHLQLCKTPMSQLFFIKGLLACSCCYCKWMLVELSIYLLDLCIRIFLIWKFRGFRIILMEIKCSDT